MNSRGDAFSGFWMLPDGASPDGRRRRASSVSLVHGASCSEEAIGTTSPGVCLARKNPVQVAQAIHNHSPPCAISLTGFETARRIRDFANKGPREDFEKSSSTRSALLTCGFLGSCREMCVSCYFFLRSLRSPRCIVSSLIAALPRCVLGGEPLLDLRPARWKASETIADQASLKAPCTHSHRFHSRRIAEEALEFPAELGRALVADPTGGGGGAEPLQGH